MLPLQYGPGKVGKLSDGTTVVARPGSKTGGVTLEIRVSNSKVYKVTFILTMKYRNIKITIFKI